MKQFPIRISETIQCHFRLASLFKMTGLLETSCQPLNQSDPKLKSHVTWSLAFWRQFEANNMNHRWHPSISLVCYLFSLRPLWLHFFLALRNSNGDHSTRHYSLEVFKITYKSALDSTLSWTSFSNSGAKPNWRRLGWVSFSLRAPAVLWSAAIKGMS